MRRLIRGRTEAYMSSAATEAHKLEFSASHHKASMREIPSGQVNLGSSKEWDPDALDLHKNPASCGVFRLGLCTVPEPILLRTDKPGTTGLA